MGPTPLSPLVQESASSSSSDSSFASVDFGALVRALLLLPLLLHLPTVHSRTPLQQVMTDRRSGVKMMCF